MHSTTPIFEQVVSPLYASNDGRVRINTVPGKGNRHSIDTRHVIVYDDEPIFSTKNRVLVDAYIAGYDLARENAA